MLCEMCGKSGPTRLVFIEGTKLNVCPNCSKFGDENRGQSGKVSAAPAPSASVIEERLQRRERRMQTKDVFSGAETTEIIEDYGRVIREARTAKGLDIEQFSASLSEKKGTLTKVEANDLVPDEKLMRKIEKSLGIKLTETVSSGASTGGNAVGKMTLENFIIKK